MSTTFTMTPIGSVRSDRDTPRDDHWGGEVSRIRLDLDVVDADAVLGLDSFSHIEVIYVFDRVDPATVESGSRTPRGNDAWPRVGILAQRGKRRPNRIGVTMCEIIQIDGHEVVVRGLDAIDGTPVLDIKPVMHGFLPRSEIREPEWAREIMTNYWHPRRRAT